MKKKLETYTKYHSSFMGDTYDACARCGGKCEKFKISTLMPAEKEFMAEKLNISITELEERFLSAINTPYGNVDVLKMKNNCPFLDEDYRCTAIPAKPVMCDTYPVVFYILKGRVHFEIDQVDCPMVHWPEYQMAVEDFETNGIKALKEMKIPFSWWKKVALFDEFDVDYVKIEQDLAKTKGYEEFYLEEILGYACNGYEKKARKRGLLLLNLRMQNFSAESRKKINNWSRDGSKRVEKTGKACLFIIDEQINLISSHIRELKADNTSLDSSDNSQYLSCIRDGFRVLDLLKNYLASFKVRMKEVMKCEKKTKLDKKLKSKIIQTILPVFKVNFPDLLPKLSFYQITQEGSSDFWDSMILLTKTFAPNELDSPLAYFNFIRNDRKFKGSVFIVKEKSGEKKIWAKWIMVLARDESGRIVGVADGALITDSRLTLFYASHISIESRLRSQGMGPVLSAAILQAAEDNIREGMAKLGLTGSPEVSGEPQLDVELGEVEYPDPSPAGLGSIKRLTFHGRIGREALWPFRYAQPDTNYQFKEFNIDHWNSIPMFLAFRGFIEFSNKQEIAMKAATLLYDYFICSMGKGAAWDKQNMLEGIELDGSPSFVPFPKAKEELNNFIKSTGMLPTVLKNYYLKHKFSLDYFIQR